MSTASTRRSRKVKQSRQQVAVPLAVAPVPAIPLPVAKPAIVALPEISERAWLVSCVCILLVAAALRFYALELKPFHHDEGVNGFFMTSLVHQGIYKYDPTNYHGPTLYYLALPTTVLFGLGMFALRATTAIFGFATVWLLFGLRRQLGSVATLTAAALIAISPGAVYYSRYFIHETLFAFFALAIVVAAVRFYETGRYIFIAAGTIAAALLFATKETAFVSIITLALAWLFVEVWIRKVISPQGSRQKHAKKSNAGEFDYRQILTKFRDRQHVYLIALALLGLFVVVNIIFYSSFLSNWKGVNDAVSALAVWSKTGTSEFHGKSFDTYIGWLMAEESPLILLAIAGSFIALFERRLNRFAIFAGAWGFGMLAAYSFIPYKTPWLMLNFIVPMALVAGYALPAIAERFHFGRSPLVAAVVVFGAAITVGAYQSTVLNFRAYDNDAYPYVYAHTSRELHKLVVDVEALAARTGQKDISISIASPEYWPLPWYFRNNRRVGFYGSISAFYDPNEVPLVIGRESSDPAQDQTKKLKEMLAGRYQQVGSYVLRPGVSLALFARRELAQP